MKAAIGLFLSAVLAAAPAIAENSPEKAGGPQDPSGFKAADQELNQTYRALMLQLNSAKSDYMKTSDVKNSIILTQRVWLKLRDLDCSIAGSEIEWNGGDAATSAVEQCKMRLTKERTVRLQGLTQVFKTAPESAPLEIVGVLYEQPNPNGHCGASTFGFIVDGQSTKDASDAGRVDFCVEALSDNLKLSSNLEVDPKLKDDARTHAILKKAATFKSLKMIVHVEEESIDAIDAK